MRTFKEYIENIDTDYWRRKWEAMSSDEQEDMMKDGMIAMPMDGDSREYSPWESLEAAARYKLMPERKMLQMQRDGIISIDKDIGQSGPHEKWTPTDWNKLGQYAQKFIIDYLSGENPTPNINPDWGKKPNNSHQHRHPVLGASAWQGDW